MCIYSAYIYIQYVDSICIYAFMYIYYIFPVWVYDSQYVFIKLPCCQTAITRIMCWPLITSCNYHQGPAKSPVKVHYWSRPYWTSHRTCVHYVSKFGKFHFKKNVMSVWGWFFFNSHTCSCVSSNFRSFQPPAKKQRASHSTRLQLEQHLGRKQIGPAVS